MTRALVLLLALLVSLPSVVRGQAVTLAGPANVSAEDVPDDIGGQVMVKWSLSPDDKLLPDGTRAINGYAIYRKVVPNAMALESGAETAAGTGELGFADDFDYEANQPVGTVPYSVDKFLDETKVPGKKAASWGRTLAASLSMLANLLVTYRADGRIEEAYAAAKIGLAGNPDYLQGRMAMADALLDMGRHEDARAAFEDILDRDPNAMTALGKLGAFHYHTGEFDAA